jgi:hypothetical protein
MRLWSGIRLTLIVALLLFTAYNGLYEGFNATRYGASVGQRVATGTQLAYGAFAVAALAAMVARRRWAGSLLVLWGIAVVATGALAPVVWGDTPVRVGVLAGLATAGVVGLVLWGWRAHVRRRNSATERAPSIPGA